MREKVERHLRVWVKAHIQPAPRDYGMSSIWSCSLRLAVAIGPTTAHEPSVVTASHIRTSGQQTPPGSAMAQDYLGVFYATGQGVTKNYAEAAKWFRKAAEQNFAKAQSHLGLSYAEGEGVPKDYVEGYRWCSSRQAKVTRVQRNM